MKIIYIPGSYPVPMLSYFIEPNKNVFDSMKQSDITKSSFSFTSKYNHIWNISAYLVYNDETLEVVGFITESIAHLVYLLRVLNKPLVFKLNSEQMEILKKELETNFCEEFTFV